MNHSRNLLVPTMGFKPVSLLSCKLFYNLGLLCIFVFYYPVLKLNQYSETECASINYGVDQQPITDMSQLMPKLCRNQSVICEGSYCIPGIKRCVCDLRSPVQIGKFCLKQIDIETKCFASSQCNHTVKDAVCIDINSNANMDSESSKFKLEQWQQLNILRQISPSPSQSAKFVDALRKSDYVSNLQLEDTRHRFAVGEKLIYSSLRTSPYEINYNTPDLLKQNFSKKRNSSNYINIQDIKELSTEDINESSTHEYNQDLQSSDQQTTHHSENQHSSLPTTTLKPVTISTQQSSYVTSTSQTLTQRSFGGNNNAQDEKTKLESSEQSSSKKVSAKPVSWPPGICACRRGFMFDAMLRKCLSLSLSDSHCNSDTDCKQIASTHCLSETRKCSCDEPFEWDDSLQACSRPRSTISPPSQDQTTFPPLLTTEYNLVMEQNFLPKLILNKLTEDNVTVLLIFVVTILVLSLLILKVLVKCSSENSVLISPKQSKHGANFRALSSSSMFSGGLKDSSRMFVNAEMTKGRILNYDFEQENCYSDEVTNSTKASRTYLVGTLKAPSKVRKPVFDRPKSAEVPSHIDRFDSIDDDNDGFSILDSTHDDKKETLNNIERPANQLPPYMMSGSGLRAAPSAIAAAAAAVANKRRQQKNLDQQLNFCAAETTGPAFL